MIRWSSQRVLFAAEAPAMAPSRAPVARKPPTANASSTSLSSSLPVRCSGIWARLKLADGPLERVPGGDARAVRLRPHTRRSSARLQLADAFLAFYVATGVFLFAYCVLVTSYPFNAFLGACVGRHIGCVDVRSFSSTVGQFVLLASLRIQANPANKAVFRDIAPERSVEHSRMRLTRAEPLPNSSSARSCFMRSCSRSCACRARKYGPADLRRG